MVVSTIFLILSSAVYVVMTHVPAMYSSSTYTVTSTQQTGPFHHMLHAISDS